MRFKSLLIWSLVSALIPGVLASSTHGQQGDNVPSAKAADPPEQRTAHDVYKECETLVSEGKYDKAIPLLSRILDASPSYVPAALLRAHAFKGLGETELALESLNLAVNAVHSGRSSPDNSYVEALKQRGKSLMALGAFDEATKDFEKVISKDPSDPEYLFLRGKAYVRLARANPDYRPNTNRAIASLTRAIAIKDDYAEAYAERGNAYGLSGRFEEAIGDFKKAVEVGGKTSSWNRSFADLVGEYTSDEQGGRKQSVAARLEQCKARRDFLAAARKAVKPELGDPLNDDIKSVEATIDELTPVLTVYALKFSAAAETVQVLGSTLEGEESAKIAVDSRTNRLIISASKKTHEQVEAMLKQLDQPIVDDKKSVTRSFAVGREATGDFQTLIRDMNLKLYGTQSNGRTTVFSVAGTNEALDQLEEQIPQLEEKNKPQPRTIRIVWLTSDADQNEKQNIPDDIKEVVGELQKVGIKDMSVKSQLSVRTTGKFTTSCLQDGGFELSADGEYSNDSLELQLEITQPDVVRGKTQARSLVKLKTQIEAQLGHPVVLGVSPSSSGHSVFVVVVEE